MAQQLAQNMTKHPEGQIPSNLSEREYLRERQLNIVLGHYHQVNVINLLGAIAVATFFWSTLPKVLLSSWMGGAALLGIARIALAGAYSRSKPIAESDVSAWRRWHIVLTGLGGLHWGLIGLMLPEAGGFQQQVFAAFIVAGVSAAVVPLYSAGVWSFPLFATAAMAPLAGRFMTSVEEPQVATGTMMVLLLAALLAASRETRRILLSNLSLSHALHHRAIHDSLVGLVNHGEFQRRLAETAERCKSARRPYGLVFIDLDLFKTVNDRGGHAAGDAMLRQIAGLIESQVRTSDTAARVGGDEFALLLEGCGEFECTRVAHAVLEAIDEFCLEYEGHAFRVGASIGVAFSEHGAESATDLMRAADQACYSAKEGGRNRIEVSEAGFSSRTTGRFELLRTN